MEELLYNAGVDIIFNGHVSVSNRYFRGGSFDPLVKLCCFQSQMGQIRKLPNRQRVNWNQLVKQIFKKWVKLFSSLNPF